VPAAGCCVCGLRARGRSSSLTGGDDDHDDDDDDNDDNDNDTSLCFSLSGSFVLVFLLSLFFVLFWDGKVGPPTSWTS
jgi:hypothetical protein